jgi:DNA-binding CsgD family transcriptional regulator
MGMGILDDDTLSTVAGRLARLNGKLSDREREQFKTVAQGNSLLDIANDLRKA